MHRWASLLCVLGIDVLCVVHAALLHTASPLCRTCSSAQTGLSSRIHSAAFRLAKIWIVGLVHRIKFYFVWTLSDANLTLAGFGFNGWKDKARREARWDRHTNGWPLEIELASSTAKLMHVWNCKTGVFLKRCALFPQPCGHCTAGEQPLRPS